MAPDSKTHDTRREGDPHLDQARLYGRRAGHRLKPHPQHLMETLLPKLEVPLSAAGGCDPSGLFPPPQSEQIWLEIGFGGGEHLVARAGQHPDIGFIGAEFFVNGIASCLVHLEEAGLSNVRLHTVDARLFLESLKSSVLDRIFLLYPDPWPKARHNKRRFISDWSLDEFARVLKPGGRLQVATDIPDYCRWTLAHIRRHGAFEWTAQGPDDWRTPPEGWPGTRYEAKALREGRTPVYLDFCLKNEGLKV
ncbi:MAG: tRNA (guanosine(46)-N7)-methyltransferase TrmB [Alphaproteobacteria bacterium]|nr:MAG: tRNA (guanosine(46)-N7)-methyltransferase TrmB [Alphaproteobacteria bacterium]